MKALFSRIFIPALAAVLVCTSLGGCDTASAVSAQSGVSSSSAASSSASKKAHTTSLTHITIPYAMNLSMNPFTANSMINLNLWPLLYDCLSEPDKSFSPRLELASAIHVSGTSVSITLRSGVVFTDGSALTASDVVYSLQLAMQTPSSYFHSRTTNFASVSSNGSQGVVITLKTSDPLVANLLDIPIIKAGSDQNSIPTGSGRYTISKSGNNEVLTANASWYLHKTPKVKTITLLDMPDNDSIASCLSIGEVNYILSDYGTDALTVVNDSSTYIDLNQLLFMGVNCSSSLLSDARVRRALSLIVDRTAIATEIYSSHAAAACLPFDPSFSKMAKTPAADLSPRLDDAIDALKTAGYTAKNATGVLTKSEDGKQTPLTFNLIVNKADSQRCATAQIISQEFKNEGISLKVSAVDINTFTDDLKSGAYDLYLSEIKLPDDMDVSSFFEAGGTAAYGTPGAASTFYSVFEKWRAGIEKITSLSAAFEDETPFIPLIYRQGTVSYPKSFFSNITATNHNIFFNIQDWQ
ncbi:MAG: ABC transporter substrate-binding protein [Clostridia bacterium]|nr:ABC transporter substrate-binding protein [Clostridia bacterium]